MFKLLQFYRCEVPVKVTITSDDKQETWVREFDGQPFSSNLSLDEGGFMQERFGPLSIRLGLELRNEKLLYPVMRGRVFGFIPFPTFLMPQSISHEEVDEKGRFVFDVLLKFRSGLHIWIDQFEACKSSDLNASKSGCLFLIVKA